MDDPVIGGQIVLRPQIRERSVNLFPGDCTLKSFSRLCQRFLIICALISFTMIGYLSGFGTDVAVSRFSGFRIFALLILCACSGLCLVSLWGLRSGRTRRVAQVWLAVVAFLAPYVVIESALAILLRERFSPLVVVDDTVHHRLQPDSLVDVYNNEYQYVQRVNHLGLRGADVGPGKTRNVFRILMLGDSFTMGMGVPDGKTFSVVLQDRLQSSGITAGGRRVEVLNAGVSSYTPVLSYLQFRRLQPIVQPDLVVLNFDVSDLMQEVAYRRHSRFSDSGELIGISGFADDQGSAAATQIERLRSFVRRRMLLTRELLYWLERLRDSGLEATVDNTVRTPEADLLLHTLAADTQDRDFQWANIEESVTSIQELCRENQIHFVMTQYPWGHQVSEQEWPEGRKWFVRPTDHISDRSVQRVQQIASRLGVALLNAYPAFRAEKSGERLYYDDDMHWTPAGHRLMAELLLEFLTPFITDAEAGTNPMAASETDASLIRKP